MMCLEAPYNRQRWLLRWCCLQVSAYHHFWVVKRAQEWTSFVSEDLPSPQEVSEGLERPGVWLLPHIVSIIRSDGLGKFMEGQEGLGLIMVD